MTEETAAPTGDNLSTVESGNGLFSTAQAISPDVVPATSPTDQVNPQSWHWAEGVQGAGDRPEWLKEKYKTVSEQAIAYEQLEKKFGEFRGAPAEGYDMSQIDGVDTNSEMIKGLSGTLKELNLSQAGFERLVKEYSTYQGQVVQADVAEEIKKLGPQGSQMINQANQWLKNTFDEATVKTIGTWIQTADDMKAFEALRSFQPRSAAPTAHQMHSGIQYESLSDVKKEKTENWERYQSDSAYRKALSDRLASAVHRQDAGKKK